MAGREITSINTGQPLKEVLAEMISAGKEEIEFDINLPSGVETTWSIRLVRLTDEEGTVLKDTIARVVVGGENSDG